AMLVLLVVAGMTLSMLRRFGAVELGFDPTSVTSVELSFPRGTSGARVAATLEGVRQRLEDSAAVESASYAFPTVYDIGGTSMAGVATDYAPGPRPGTPAGSTPNGARVVAAPC